MNQVFQSRTADMQALGVADYWAQAVTHAANMEQLLRKSSGDLISGVQRLRKSSDDLVSGVQRLRKPSGDLISGVQRLRKPSGDPITGV